MFIRMLREKPASRCPAGGAGQKTAPSPKGFSLPIWNRHPLAERKGVRKIHSKRVSFFTDSRIYFRDNKNSVQKGVETVNSATSKLHQIMLASDIGSRKEDYGMV
jgi:hypothetical protein